MSHTIAPAKLGDEKDLAYIQTESWRAAFASILPPETLEECTQVEKVTQMYRMLLETGKHHGYLLRVENIPHAIAWWGDARGTEFLGHAELICIHSLPNNWRRGYGSRLMEQVLRDMKAAGYRKVMLWVFADNHRARAFYETWGFAATGMEKPGMEPVELLYQREL